MNRCRAIVAAIAGKDHWRRSGGPVGAAPAADICAREVRTHAAATGGVPGLRRKTAQVWGKTSLKCSSVSRLAFRVIRHVRVKLACACCERIVETAAPSRPIERGLAGPGLLAHVLVSKVCVYLSAVISPVRDYAREGVELDRSTLADWVGETSRLFDPLLEVLRRHVMNAQKLHADDTPVPVLAPGLGRTKTGRLWTYVRDDRPAGDQTPPAVWFAYSPDRKGEHPQGHLRQFTGTLQAE